MYKLLKELKQRMIFHTYTKERKFHYFNSDVQKNKLELVVVKPLSLKMKIKRKWALDVSEMCTAARKFLPKFVFILQFIEISNSAIGFCTG